MQGTVSIPEFMQHLEQKGLVIVHKSRVKGALPPSAEEIERLQHQYMKRRALTIAEIVEARLLPLSAKESVQGWIKSGRILPQEILRGNDAKKTIKILTEAIKRLGYW